MDQNPTEDHENLVNNTINDLVSEHAIDEDTYHLFCAEKCLRSLSSTCFQRFIRKAYLDALWYHLFLAQQKKISAFVDELLKPISQEFPSYILQKIDKVSEISEDKHMMTLDVESLYTNIDKNEGLPIFEEEPKKKTLSKEHPKLCHSSVYEASSYSRQLCV